ERKSFFGRQFAADRDRLCRFQRFGSDDAEPTDIEFGYGPAVLGEGVGQLDYERAAEVLSSSCQFNGLSAEAGSVLPTALQDQGQDDGCLSGCAKHVSLRIATGVATI